MPFRALPLLALLVAACAAQTPRRDATPAADFTARDLERAVHEAANDARRDEGRAALDWEPALVPIARAHSADMGRRDYFAHTSPDGRSPTDRATAGGYTCRTELGEGRYREGVGENLWSGAVYAGYTDTTGSHGTTRTYDFYSLGGLARTIVTDWLGSPGHRRNLLDPITRVHALGIWIGEGGRVFVTQSLC